MSDNWEPEVVEESTPPPAPFGMLESRPPSPALDAPPADEATAEVVAASETMRYMASADGIIVTEAIETVEIYRSDEGDFVVDVVDTVETVSSAAGTTVSETVEVTAIPLPTTATPTGAASPALRAPTPAGLKRPRPAATAPIPTRHTDPARFGRIDDDGTAWLVTPVGEVIVGQWAAGTREEGLAFFGRKFDDIQVEVDLAAHRLREGRGVEAAKAAVDHARAALAAPSFIGDVIQLSASCDEIEALMAEQQAQREEARRRQREEALAAREAIVTEAESLAESRQWKATGERLAALLEAWQAAPRIDRAREQALWKRFSAARGTFDRHRRQHFAGLEAQRREAIAAKRALIAEAQALSTSTQWADTTRAYRDLMTRWKSAGHAGRQDEERLWAQFRAAQDAFFAARDAANAERDVEFRGNLERKEALLAEAERLVPVKDIPAAKKTLRSVQDRWEKIGHVPRSDKERVEGRLRAVEEAVRRAEQQRWSATNPEVRARAEDTAEKFRLALAKSEAALAAARDKGDLRAVAEAERSIESTRALLAAVEGTVSEFSQS